MGEVVAVLSLLINWDPEEDLRELALSAIPQDISIDEEVQQAASGPDSEDTTGSLLPPDTQLTKGTDFTEVISFSTDYHF